MYVKLGWKRGSLKYKKQSDLINKRNVFRKYHSMVEQLYISDLKKKHNLT